MNKFAWFFLTWFGSGIAGLAAGLRIIGNLSFIESLALIPFMVFPIMFGAMVKNMETVGDFP